jgi:hypothetical protein
MNNRDHAAGPFLTGDNDEEIFEIKPVILGGSPTDPANKIVLTREQHIQAVRYWTRIVRQIRRGDD